MSRRYVDLTPDQQYKLKQRGIVDDMGLLQAGSDPDQAAFVRGITGSEQSPASQLGDKAVGAFNTIKGALGMGEQPKANPALNGPKENLDGLSDAQREQAAAEGMIRRATQAGEQQIANDQAYKQGGLQDWEQKEGESPEDYDQRTKDLARQAALQRVRGQ